MKNNILRLLCVFAIFKFMPNAGASFASLGLLIVTGLVFDSTPSKTVASAPVIDRPSDSSVKPS